MGGDDPVIAQRMKAPKAARAEAREKCVGVEQRRVSPMDGAHGARVRVASSREVEAGLARREATADLRHEERGRDIGREGSRS